MGFIFGQKRNIAILLLSLLILNTCPFFALASSNENSVSWSADKGDEGINWFTNGIHFLNGAETRFTQLTYEGKQCRNIGVSLSTNDRLAYFELNDEWYKNGNQTLYVTLEYFDLEGVRFQIEYDSTDGADTPSRIVQTKGTKSWQKVVVELPKARFDNKGRFGTDFTLRILGGGTSFYVAGIEVSKSKTEHEPFIAFNDYPADAGITVTNNINKTVYANLGAAVLSNLQEMHLDIDDSWGVNVKKASVKIKYLDNGAQFDLVHGSSVISLGNGNSSGSYVEQTVILNDCNFAKTNDLIVINKSPYKDLIIAMVKVYQMSADTAQLNSITDEEILQKSIGENSSFEENMEGGKSAFKITGVFEENDERYKALTFSSVNYKEPQNINLIYADIEYFDNGATNNFFELRYQASDGSIKKSGKVYLENSGEWKRQTFILRDISIDKEVFKILTNYQSFYVNVVKIQTKSPFNANDYCDFATDFGYYQNSMRTSQGYRGWTFNAFINNEYEPLILKGGQWRTARDSYPYLLLKQSGPSFHPGRYEDLAVKWTSPKSGTVTIYSTPKMETKNTGNGVNAKVLCGSRTLSNRDILPSDIYGTTDILKVNIQEGEELSFRLNAIESQLSYDVTRWDILIAFNDIAIARTNTNVVKSSAWTDLGTLPTNNGAMIVASDELHFYDTKENGVIVMKHSPVDGVQRAAFKLDEHFTSNLSGLNPLYFAVKYFDSPGIGLKLEYSSTSGDVVQTEYTQSCGTNRWQKAFFMVTDIDLSKNIKVIGELGNGIQLMRFEASTVPMSDYEINMSPNREEGLYITNSTVSKSLVNKQFYEITDFIGLNIHDSFMYSEAGTSAYLEVEYYANGSSMEVSYDNVTDINQKLTVFKTENSNTVKKAFFKLPQGYFANRQKKGSDISITNVGQTPLYISKISVGRSISPGYYAEFKYGLDLDADTKEVDSKNAVMIQPNAMVKGFLDDNFLYNVPNSGLYYAIVTYKDDNGVKFKIDYDGYPLPSNYTQEPTIQYRESWTVNGTGTGQWRTTLISLPYAKFSNSQDGSADFRINNLGDTLYVESITIRGGATFGLRDIATLDCMVDTSSLGEDGTEKNKNQKAFGPDYEKVGLGGLLDGTSSEGPDYITVYFPYLQETKVSGIKVSSFADFAIEYWDSNNATWVKIANITNSYTAPHDDRIIMFDPVYTSALRYSGYDYRGNFYLKKVEVYGGNAQDRTLHKGKLEVTQNGPFEKIEDATFNIKGSSFDDGQGEYTLKVDWKNYYKDTIKENVINTKVNSNEIKDINFVISQTDPLYESGAYYLTCELWKDNILLDKVNELWGIKGIAPRENAPAKAPRYAKQRSLGTIGQFHFGLGSPIEPEAIRQLKEAGFKSIQIECFWGDIEPILGVYNFELYDRALEVARECGLTVDLSIHMLDRRNPSWIPDEEIMRDQFGGYVVPRSMQIYEYNDFVYTPSYWGEVTTERLDKAIDALVKRYKDDPIISGYAISTAATEVSFSSDSYRFFDYSEPSQKAYKEVFLQGKLGLDLDALNKRWGTSYTNWHEVRMFAPLYDLNIVETNPQWVDTLEFLHFSITQYQKRISQIIHTADPSRDLQFFMNEHYSYDKELNDMKLKYNDSGVGDLAVENGDSFPQFAFFGRIVGTRVHSEPGNIPAKTTIDGNAGRALFLSASGGRSTITWQATKLPRAIGTSYTNDTLAGDGGTKVIAKNQRLTEEVLGAEYTENEAAAISQLKSWSTEKALRTVGRSTDAYSNGLTKNQLETALLEHEFDNNLHRGVDWFNAEYAPDIYMSVDKLKKYKIIFDCGNKVLNATAQKNLIEYVKQGGKLVLMGDSGYLDDNRQNEWNLLKELSGGKAVPPDEISTTAIPVVFQPGKIFSVERSIRLRNTRDISTWTWAETLGTSSGNPMVKKWDFGQGSVIYAAGVPDIIITPQFNGWLASLYDWAGVTSKAETKKQSVSGNCEGIYTAVKQSGSDRYVLMWSNSPNGQTLANVKLNYLDVNKKYNVYLMKKDHDVFLQTVSGAKFLNQDILFDKNELKVLKYTEAENYKFTRDFSQEQLKNRLTYGFDEGGGFTETIDFDEERNIHTSGRQNQSSIGAGFFVPTAKVKSILKWTAPKDGYLTIKGPIEIENGANNIKATILQGDTVIWTNDINSNYYNSSVAMQVKKCDKIFFVVEGEGNLENGKVFWDLALNLVENAQIHEVSKEFQTIDNVLSKTWVAPTDGRAIIYGYPKIIGGKDGNATIGIYRNNLGLWHQNIYDNTTGEHYLEIDVKKNQIIKFSVNEWNSSADMNWSPKIMLIY